MSERMKRLVMNAFRGVPNQMVVDFKNTKSMAVFGDNGTGKSTIADALEWYFTGNIELLSHEGRQHAVGHLGGSAGAGGETSVKLETNGPLGGSASTTEEPRKELDLLLKNLDADVQVALNVEAHAGRGRSSPAEVEAALDRIEELDKAFSCPSCKTRIWFEGGAGSGRCKCSASRFPPLER